MGLKSIFQEGMKERKRKKSLGKISNEFKEKEKVHSGHLTALGQKAWEAKTDISAFADVQAALGSAQQNLDDLTRLGRKTAETKAGKRNCKKTGERSLQRQSKRIGRKKTGYRPATERT